MPKVLGMDPSKARTGWALMEPNRTLLEVGSFRSESIRDFAVNASALIARHEPDFFVYERALEYIVIYDKRALVKGIVTPNADQIILWKIDGWLEGWSTMSGIEYLRVAPATWRAAVFGEGGGKLDRERAKKKAKEHCRLCGYAVKNHDAAEAVCIAEYGLSTAEFRFGVLQSGPPGQ